MKKWIKITLIAAAVLAALIVIAAIAVSPVAKNYIEKHDRELIGRSIRMERLRMNIFTGRLRIEGLRIGGSEDSTTFFRLDSFEMRMRLWPLLGNRVLVKKISFAGPDVKIYQRGNAFSFDDITARFAGDTTAAATPEKPSKPWEIGIYDISIRNGRVFYKDLALDAEWGMNDLNLHIPGVYFSGEKTDVGAVLNFAEGGSLSTDVGYNIESSEFDIGIRLQDFALAGTLPYFRQSLDVTAVGRHPPARQHGTPAFAHDRGYGFAGGLRPARPAAAARGGRRYAGGKTRRRRSGQNALCIRPHLCFGTLGAVRNDARRQQSRRSDEIPGGRNRFADRRFRFCGSESRSGSSPCSGG